VPFFITPITRDFVSCPNDLLRVLIRGGRDAGIFQWWLLAGYMALVELTGTIKDVMNDERLMIQGALVPLLKTSQRAGHVTLHDLSTTSLQACCSILTEALLALLVDTYLSMAGAARIRTNAEDRGISFWSHALPRANMSTSTWYTTTICFCL
jgi:hypothetical protein